MKDQEIETGELEERLRSIERRLSRMEEVLENANSNRSYSYAEKPSTIEQAVLAEGTDDEGKGLESRIGRFGLAWMGNIVLLFGIIFLAQYLMNLGYSLFSALLGYVAAISIFFLSKYLKRSNAHMAFMFKMNGQILLFYITVRLYFFSETPLIQYKAIVIVLLLGVIAYQVYWAVRNKSQSLSVISVIFTLTTAVITDTTHFMLPLVILTALGSVYYFSMFRWEPLLFITMILTYIAFFLWLFGNPVMGNRMVMISEHNYGILYLFGLGACYSTLLLFRQKDSSSDEFFIGVTFTNGIIFTLFLLLVVTRFFSSDYVLLFGTITLCCLVFSTLLHKKSDWNFASAYYALYGFMAMSIALYGLYGFPKVYFLLSFQSLLVVSMALWFRNRLIVIMNSILFLTILLGYLISAKSIDSVNFSFALIALVSARIINWQKSRLKIETDMIRNLYMLEGFVMVLLALFHSVPKHLITLSWTMAALLYFLLSILLKNVKYRYMALGTMICAALYLFLVDLAKIELIYRVLALLFLSAISIGISMYYSNRIKKADS
jgi:hypothetical protein